LPADVAGRAAVILRMMLLTEVVGEPGAIYVTTTVQREPDAPLVRSSVVSDGGVGGL
jgi:hypothetical protein